MAEAARSSPTAPAKGRARATVRARPRSTRSAADFIPPRPTIPKARAASKGCRGCHLWKVGTQTVFGEGPSAASVIFVGEQPGDQEDRAGHPFVGPAGRLFDTALQEAGIDRDTVYLTNAVKHFKWKPAERGERRIHQKPNAGEISACHPWLDLEISLIKPRIVVCLGAVAAQALLGKSFRVTKERGKAIPSEDAGTIIATVHPSSVLRSPDAESRARAMREFVRDLKVVAGHIRRRA